MMILQHLDAPLNKAWSNIEATLPVTTPAN